MTSVTETRSQTPTTETTDDAGTHGPAKGIAALALAALGVVFGDIGTSPLYALRTVFTIDGGIVQANQEDVYGVISMMFWSITVIVSIKYVLVLMRADNNGEGGVMALAALARGCTPSGAGERRSSSSSGSSASRSSTATRSSPRPCPCSPPSRACRRRPPRWNTSSCRSPRSSSCCCSRCSGSAPARSATCSARSCCSGSSSSPLPASRTSWRTRVSCRASRPPGPSPSSSPTRTSRSSRWVRSCS